MRNYQVIVNDKKLIEATNAWLVWLNVERNLSPNTVRSYKKNLGIMLHFSHCSINQPLTLELLENHDIKFFRAWLLSLSQIGYENETIANAISALRSFYKFLNNNFNFNNSAIFSISRPKVAKRLPRPIDKEQVKTLLNGIKSSSEIEWMAKRNYAIAMLLYGCGLRISEALNLSYSDIQDDDWIKVLGKGSRERLVPVLPVVIQSIREYVESVPFDIKDSHFLFLGKSGKPLRGEVFRKTLKKVYESKNISHNITPHMLRHSCATHLLDNDVGLREIQELLGHSSLSSTQQYLGVSSKKVLDIYSQCHPRAN